jgi:hypothetical protein
VGPTGAQGNPGATGHPGAQGATGVTGAQGSTGGQGAQGSQGGVGPTGAQGNPGATGHPGAQGSGGATGNQGAQGVGAYQGAQGAPGVSAGGQGAQGAQGTNGTPGGQGAQGAIGFTPGTSGPQGAQGAGGPGGGPGPTGAQGNVGPTATTCYSHSGCAGSSVLQACNCVQTAFYYQQTSFNDFQGIKYNNLTNCQNSTCDWNGTYDYVGSAAAAYGALGYSCGSGGTGYLCGGSPYSDERLKNGIETLKNALENIMKIEAVEYDWNENLREYEYFKTQQKLHTIGLIAQNVRLYYPEAVRINNDGYYSIDYTKLNAVLVEGIKEQSIFIESIDKELDYIETKLS